MGKMSVVERRRQKGADVDAFDQFFDQIEDQAAIVKFVRRQLKNTRKPVAKKAEKFLRQHAT